MKFGAALATAAILLITADAAAAGPIVDAAQQAETLLSQGKSAEAMDVLQGAMDAAWDTSPLGFRKAMLSNDADNAADRTEIADHKVQRDQKIAIYMEPVGFAVRQDGDDQKAEFAVDWTFENATGQIILDRKDFAQLTVSGHDRPRGIGLTLRTTVPFIRPGEYLSTYTIRDKNSSKSASFKVPMTVVPGGGDAPAGTAPAATSQGG